MKLVLCFCLIFHQTSEKLSQKPPGNLTNSRPSQQVTDDGLESVDLSKLVQSQFPLYLDVAVFVSRSAIKALANNNTNIDTYFHMLFKETAKIFAWHFVKLSVRSIETWNEDNKFYLLNLEDLDSFSSYLEANQTDFFDAYLLFIDSDRYTEIRNSNFDRMCSISSAVILDVGRMSQWKPQLVANALARQLGYTMGFPHTSQGSQCECLAKEEKYCVMYGTDELGPSHLPRAFETCNIKHLLENLNSYPCLLGESPSIRRLGSCGDAFKDEDEECDCGGPYLCKVLDKDRCCDGETCMFRNRGYECSAGECCHRCMYIKNVECRESDGECDLIEYCNGRGPNCPVDRVKPNFELCGDNQGFCYNGLCTNTLSLCRHVFNNVDVFFSQDCVYELKQRIRTGCRGFGLELKKLVCGRNFSVCDHFVCAHPRHTLKETDAFFGRNRQICLIPKFSIRVGVMKIAADYTKCSKLEDKFCLKGNCVDGSTKLENCKNGACKEIKVLISKFQNTIVITNFKALFIFNKIQALHSST